MSQNTTGWRPDPYGVHELRFFAADGTPTLLVMDGGRTSYDRPPSNPSAPTPAQPLPAPPVAESEPSPPPPPPPPRPPLPSPHAPSEPDVASPGTAHRAEPVSEQDQRARPLLAAVVHADIEDDPPVDPRQRHERAASSSTTRRVAYGVVLLALVLSASGFAYVHLLRPSSTHHTALSAGTTTTAVAKTTTTVAVPTGLQPDADTAANALVSSWSTGNRAAALTVATPAAVDALFAVPYPSGQAQDRGCSTAFQPIVCTFGPPGGGNPNDPIYEIYVSQVPGGWYVSSVRT